MTAPSAEKSAAGDSMNPPAPGPVIPDLRSAGAGGAGAAR